MFYKHEPAIAVVRRELVDHFQAGGHDAVGKLWDKRASQPAHRLCDRLPRRRRRDRLLPRCSAIQDIVKWSFTGGALLLPALVAIAASRAALKRRDARP